MFRPILILCLAIVCLGADAQIKPDTSRAGLNELCDKVMQTFADGKFSEAVQMLKQRSTLSPAFVDNLDKTMSNQMSNIIYNYKKITGFELLEEKVIKNTLARRRYILKFELYFLTFDFYLYNNGTGWSISGFYYKDDQQILF